MSTLAPGQISTARQVIARTDGTGPDPSDGQSGSGVLRWCRRSWPLILLVVAVLCTGIALAVASGGERAGLLDPAATDPSGSRALAVLLAHHDAPVDRVLGTAAGVARVPASGATVLVADPAAAPASALRRLARLGGDSRIVLVAPDGTALAALGARIRPRSGAPETRSRQPGCALAAAQTAGSVQLGGSAYADGETACYDGTLAAGHTAAGAEVLVLGSGVLLTNDQLAEDGDAALALGLLTGRGPVVWALPGGTDLAQAGGASLTDVLPGWVLPVVAELLVAGVLLGLWRGRRFGPLVAEPLPVVIRAVEVVEGRGRLYRQGSARASAGAALRARALDRLLPLLGLGRTGNAPLSNGDPELRTGMLAQTVSVRSRWPAESVQELLYGPAPADDAALVTLASELDRLVRAATQDSTDGSIGPRRETP